VPVKYVSSVVLVVDDAYVCYVFVARVADDAFAYLVSFSARVADGAFAYLVSFGARVADDAFACLVSFGVQVVVGACASLFSFFDAFYDVFLLSSYFQVIV